MPLRRFALLALTGTFLGLGLALAITIALRQPCCAGDYQLYMDVTRRWLDGGSFYQPWQLAGPYQIWASPGSVLYPPIALVLFVPFTILPTVLWFAIPLGITAWIVVTYRPRIEAWPLMALCLAWPLTYVLVANGNPVIWIVAFLALGVRFGWPSVLVLIKPSLAVFAVIGIRSRRWWAALTIFGIVALAFTTMWFDWVRAVTNATDGGLLYSAREVPLLLIPLIAAWFRSREARAASWIGRPDPQPAAASAATIPEAPEVIGSP